MCQFKKQNAFVEENTLHRSFKHAVRVPHTPSTERLTSNLSHLPVVGVDLNYLFLFPYCRLQDLPYRDQVVKPENLNGSQNRMGKGWKPRVWLCAISSSWNSLAGSYAHQMFWNLLFGASWWVCPAPWVKCRSVCLLHLTAQLKNQLNIASDSQEIRDWAPSDICSLKRPDLNFVSVGGVGCETRLHQGVHNTVQKLSVQSQIGFSDRAVVWFMSML